MSWQSRILAPARGAALLALLVTGLGASPPAAAAPLAAGPDLGAEALSYGADQIPDAQKPELRVRNFYTRTVADPTAKQITTLGNVWYQNWAPDGSRIALVNEGLTLYTMAPDGGDLKRLADGVYSNPFWSPDGRFIAYLGGEGWSDKPLPHGDLWIIPSGGGAAWKVPGATRIPSLPAGVAWSPDATKIAAGFPGQIFDVTNTDSKPAPLPGAGAAMWVLGGAWSPDGRYLGVTDGNRFGVLALADGHFTTVANAYGAVGSNKGGVSWAGGPRKAIFAVSSPNGWGHRVYTSDFDGGNAKQIWRAPFGDDPSRGNITSIGPPGASPSGQQILIRVSRTKYAGGKEIFLHESWLLRLDGSDNKLFIPDSFNAVWQPKTRFQTANLAFFNLWRQTDNAVAAGQVARPWLWGPAPIRSLTEPWTDSPGGSRQVEYYDKGRMEIANPAAPRPDKYYVTSGLLAKEMVTGQIQTGPSSFQPSAPASVVVAGDALNNPAPTYATFQKLGVATDVGKAPDRTGQPVSATLTLDGGVGADAGLGVGVRDAHFVTESGHNIPDAFWTWLQQQPDWVTLMGYPVSEPYWVRATIAGKPDQPVLVQIYERRTLSFNFQNPPEWRVELGNVGQQYLAWRYAGK
jgi:Tol biopolymer transport system component